MRRAALAAGAVLVLGWPLLAPRYFVFLASLVLVNAIVAIGLNLLSGYTHQLSFGHAGFLAIGAYTGVLLALHAGGASALVAIVGAGVVAAAGGVALGVPCLRLEGLYLTMATLAFGFVVTEALPVDALRVPAARLGPWALTTDAARYYLVVVITALLVVAALNITRMRVGRALLAIRESEIAAQASGVPVATWKTIAFALSAFYTGVAGALFAWLVGTVSPDAFDVFLSVDFVVMIVLGGLGSVPGSIIGAATVTVLNDALAGAQNYRPLIFGGILIVGMVFMPGGIAAAWRSATVR